MVLPLKIDVLPEPPLEFANAGRDVDPRRGLASHGPADDRGLRTVRLGIVGLADDIAATREWLARLDRFTPATEGNSNRFKNWPGAVDAFNARFVIEDQFVRPIDASVYSTLLKDC